MKNRDWVLGAGCWGRKAGGWGGALLLTTLAVSLSGFAKQHAELNPAENLTIELHVYDYAGVEGSELARAQDEASRVLGRVGIEGVWVNCVVPGTDATTTQACPSADGQVPALVLRILPRAMAERATRDKGSLGFAQLADDGAPGFVANVFYHRVDALAGEFGCPRAVVLGYALAHEIGHLLLGSNSHAPNGIMKANWTEKELLSASAGRFGFFPEQASKMRVEVSNRATAPAVGGERGPKLAVTIYNHAQVPGGTLDEAEAVAARIFERAGIESSWQEHHATPAGSGTITNTLQTPNEVFITMHIVPRSMAVKLAPNQVCLGLSVVPGGDKRGDMAYVFYNRVEGLARRRSLSPADSLGHAMAHEIGHLLLGTNSHSPSGLMHARWDRSDMLRAATGWLIFTDEEAERLRADVRERLIDNSAATTTETALSR